MFRYKNSFLILLGTCALMACNRVDSTHIPTENIEADISIIDHGSPSVEVSAQLQLSGDAYTFLALAPTERFSVSTEIQHRTLNQGLMVYSAHLAPSTSAQDIRLTLQRPLHHSAMNTWVTLPAPFELFLDIEGTHYGDEQVIIEWDTLATDPAIIRFEGPCIHSYERFIDPYTDDGLLMVNTYELQARHTWSGFECPIDVTVDRTRVGAIDPALGGGRISATQVRTTRFYLSE